MCMGRIKRIAPFLLFLLLLGCTAGLIVSQNKGLFSVLISLNITLMFFFPIRYDDRATVIKKARKGISLWQSPFPYLIILLLIVIIAYNT